MTEEKAPSVGLSNGLLAVCAGVLTHGLIWACLLASLYVALKTGKEGASTDSLAEIFA